MLLDGGLDAAMTIDTMGNVPPEDWSIVLDNLDRASRPSGYLPDNRRDQVLAWLSEAGWRLIDEGLHS